MVRTVGDQNMNHFLWSICSESNNVPSFVSTTLIGWERGKCFLLLSLTFVYTVLLTVM